MFGVRVKCTKISALSAEVETSISPVLAEEQDKKVIILKNSQ